MEYWEFLLQQEGDQSWLPLDTAQMEILEGRYRIMAHTSQVDTPVQIQISQRLLDQVPPKRRSLKRRGRTNGDGLLVVMPFTRLRPGTWDIQCVGLADGAGDGLAGDGLADNGEETPWRYAIQLQVLPPGSGDDELWEFTPASAGAVPETVVYGSGGQSITDPVPLPQPEPPPRSQAASPIALDLSQVTAALSQAQANLATGDLQGAGHRLSLSQSALVGHEGAPLGLAGQVAGPATADSLALTVRLSDPQTSEVVALSSFALAGTPTDFSLEVTVPTNLSTRLLLGEIALVTAGDDIAVLALQRFTVTVDLASLFDAIANQGETEADLSVIFPTDLGDLERDRQESEAWANVDFPTGPPRSVPSFTLPRSGLNLPPRIYYPSPHEVSARRPTLPPFSEAKVKERSRDDGAIGSDPSSADHAPRIESSDSPDTDQPPADAASRTGLSLPPVSAPRPVAKDPSPKPPMPLLPSHEAAGFRDLKLEDRFWSRLNDIAVTLQQEARQKQRGPGSPSVTDAPLTPEAEAIALAFAGEVVIYEDEDETLGSAAPEPPVAAADDDDDVIMPPEPELEVPSGELIAGDPVLLTLRVPFHANRLYLKVWMTDPQTRSLVDEPRQVMHLIPNGRGQLEGSLQLTVPLGCLETQFEAIAVDMVTQQESYKTTVSRSIVPPGLPAAEADDLAF